MFNCLKKYGSTEAWYNGPFVHQICNGIQHRPQFAAVG
jgi:hypothetical protein